MFILKYKKIFFGIAVLLVLLSIAAMAIRGFNVGIDFIGGSLLELSYQEQPDISVIREKIDPVIQGALVQELSGNSVLIRTKPLTPEEKASLLASLTTTGTFSEERFTSIGPSIGSELKKKSIISLVVVSIAIILFIAYVFRHVSPATDPRVSPQAGHREQGSRVSSWVYGFFAVLVLIHDVIIPAGIFAFFGIPVDTLFVVGLLTILGVSVNDTIVVFDRIRERLRTNEEKRLVESFASVVGKSISDTMTRSIMTSVTVLLALLALVIWGPQSTQNLALVMFLGMFFGTYSSVFIAAPLLVVWEERKK